MFRKSQQNYKIMKQKHQKIYMYIYIYPEERQDIIDELRLVQQYNNSKTSGSLWHYYKVDPNDNITQSESFKSKIK